MEVLDVNNLNISLDGVQRLEDSCFSMHEGDVVLLTGPNGCGKSTVIKLLMGDTFNYSTLNTKGSLVYYIEDKKQYDILGKEKDSEYFRRNVGYVSQDDSLETNNALDCFLMSLNFADIEDKYRYVWDFVNKYEVGACFSFAGRVLPNKARKLAKKLGLAHPNEQERNLLIFLTANTNRMSGGQKKLVNILTNLIRGENGRLLILDEPLNNLDYGNVRFFSNILTKMHMEHPQLAILLVTHCRSIPIVNRILEINPLTKKIVEVEIQKCNSCFGNIDENGMYI